MQRFDFKKETISRFYSELFGSMEFSNFESIDEERKAELDKLASMWRFRLQTAANGFKSRMNLLAEKLTISYKTTFKLKNGDEVAYFYIQTLDPELRFLEIYEVGNTIEDIRNLCMLNYRIFDKKLIKLEKLLNDRMQQIDSFDLIERESIRLN